MSATRKVSELLVAALAVGSLVAVTSALHGDQDPHGGAADGGCMKCHEDLRPAVEAPVPHEPAIDGDCTLCHSPHAARYEKLLNLRERALCFTCHMDERLAFTKGNIHTPIKRGECTSCHEVHGSQHAGLLVEAGNELCFKCHQDHHTKSQMPVVHEPFVDGECSDCHDPHNSDNEAQLVAPTLALCRLCHDPAEESLIAAHYDIPVRGTDCTSCHDPHASADKGLLLDVAHEPFADGSCEMCHVLESDTPRLVRASGARLCNVCHQDYPRKDDTFVHQPVADGDCGGCHVPHASDFEGLTLANAVDTCLRCHDELRQRADTSRSAHPMTFEDGRACDGCHQPHSSNEEYLLTAGAIRTCLVCHETARHGHPLGTDRVDPRTGQEITCVTCHDTHGTEFPMQLRGDRSRGLCLECHKADGH